MTFALPRLYPILDAAFLPDQRTDRDALLRAVMVDLIAAGVSILQYRNKQGSDDQIFADCASLNAAISGSTPGERRVTLMLNDRPDLVKAASFDGAHIGQEDISSAEARALIGPGRILGVSTHNAEQMRAGNQTTADYLAIGPVFATTTKEKPDPVVGLDGVRRARALTAKPLVAIGGITLANCRSVVDAGADSVAVISSLFGGLRSGASGRQPEDSGHPLEKTARDFLAELR